MWGGGQDEESEGGEHAYDSGALLKGRRVNGGREGDREIDVVRRVSCTSSSSPSPALQTGLRRTVWAKREKPRR